MTQAYHNIKVSTRYTYTREAMLLISSTNQSYQTIETINQLIKPNFGMQIDFSTELSKLISQHLDETDKQEIYQALPNEVLDKVDHYQLIPTIVAKIERPLDDHLKNRLKKSETPHINHGNELHVFLQGSGIFELKANNEKYTLEVKAGDALYLDKDTEHSFRLGPDKTLMIASFHQDEFEKFHAQVEYLK